MVQRLAVDVATAINNRSSSCLKKFVHYLIFYNLKQPEPIFLIFGNKWHAISW